MKITINIECTPEEARRFIGLPDLTAVHDVYVESLTSAMKGGISPDMLAPIIKSWSSFGEGGMQVLQQMITGFANGGSNKGSDGTKRSRS